MKTQLPTSNVPAEGGPASGGQHSTCMLKPGEAWCIECRDQPATSVTLTCQMCSERLKPKRIQMIRKKGFRLQIFSRELNRRAAVLVTRPGVYGNPFKVGDPDPNGSIISTKARAVELFRQSLMFTSPPGWWENLKGKNLACWCKPGEPCHADVLLEFANLEE